jgi:hypothetical protein
MEIINFEQAQYKKIGLRGVCPHCSAISLFEPVGTPHHEVRADLRGGVSHSIIAQVSQCIGCKNFVMAVGRVQGNVTSKGYELSLVAPKSAPQDRIDASVPANIAADLSEAIRCDWINAYKAAVAMCRRAIQAAAIDKGAGPKKKLVDQIDELAANQIITASLKEMAHEVRLTGNDGAHPGADGLSDVSAQDAKEIIEFTKELFHHVYVMPAKLKARQAPPPQGATASS